MNLRGVSFVFSCTYFVLCMIPIMMVMIVVVSITIRIWIDSTVIVIIMITINIIINVANVVVSTGITTYYAVLVKVTRCVWCGNKGVDGVGVGLCNLSCSSVRRWRRWSRTGSRIYLWVWLICIKCTQRLLYNLMLMMVLMIMIFLMFINIMGSVIFMRWELQRHWRLRGSW